MFRNYPLTTLFIIATLCVDLAVLITALRSGGVGAAVNILFYVWNFALPAQFSALGAWAIYGKSQRLTRGAWVTLAFGLLLVLTWYTVEEPYRAESVFLHFVQIAAVMMAAGLYKLCGIRPEPASGEPIRFSLVEMFGWSMIVALWAFAIRYATMEFATDKYWFLWAITALVAPILLLPVLFGAWSVGTRLLMLVVLYLVAIAVYIIGSRYWDGPLALWAFSMAITQITYISAWWAIVRMDEVMQERRAVQLRNCHPEGSSTTRRI